uniref:Major facilitator superfamily (MFS) profile domain-containing protein n=1 Tax=Globisporangium ultimum (strain ATCC 200006 / CBS 805.95 / DAOM BR144) TaxID=431595 RepID=K3W7L5_GLOUD
MCLALIDRLDHNVKFVFLFTLSYWSASSIISQQVLAGYIYVLTGSNTSVGIVKGIQGLAQLMVALPAGFAADFLRRDRILAFAGAVGVLTSLLSGFAFQVESLSLIYVSFGLWGAFTALQSPAMEALFADSVPLGQRSLPFTMKHILLNLALVIGPLCAIVLFYHYGDTWDLPALRPVMLFGTFLAAISMAALFQFNDDMAYENQQHLLAIERELNSIERNFSVEISECMPEELEEENNLLLRRESSGRLQPLSFTFSPIQSGPLSEVSQLLRSPGTLSTRSPSAMYLTNHSTGVEVLDELLFDEALEFARPAPSCCGFNVAHVPSILFISDFIISNGAGMSIHFFPLFFYKEFGLTPIQVASLFALMPICVAMCSLVAQLVSRWMGRMTVIVGTRLTGTLCLVVMAFSTSLSVQCALFLLRGAMVHCTVPLRRSLLMDFVPKKQRARWNSLEGLSMFSWAGSAFLGGFLVEAHGYRVCFAVSSLVYLVGVLLESILIPITTFAVETHTRGGSPRQRSRAVSKALSVQ